MARKLNKEEKARRDAMKQTQKEYVSEMSKIKRFLKGLLGKKDASDVIDKINTQIRQGHSEITWTAQGVPAIVTRSHPPVDKVEKAGESLRNAVKRISAEVTEGRFIEDFMVKPAKATGKAYVNRRIDSLRKAFGDDTPYTDLMKKDLSEVGPYISTKGRIQGDITVGQLFKALKIVPTLDSEISTAIQDMSSDKISPDDMKKRVKSAKQSQTRLSSIGNYLAAAKSSSSDAYNSCLQAFYNANPHDPFIAAGADYQDILDSLSHPGRKLTESEIYENMTKITAYLGGFV